MVVSLMFAFTPLVAATIASVSDQTLISRSRA